MTKGVAQIREVYIMLIFWFSDIFLSYEINFPNYLFYLLLNGGTTIYNEIITSERNKFDYHDIALSFSILLVYYILINFKFSK